MNTPPEVGNDYDISHIGPLIDVFCEENRVGGQVNLLADVCMCGFASADFVQKAFEDDKQQSEFLIELVSLAFKACSVNGYTCAEEILAPNIDIEEFLPAYKRAVNKLEEYAVENGLTIEGLLKLLAVYVGSMAYGAKDYANPEYWISSYVLSIKEYPQISETIVSSNDNE